MDSAESNSNEHLMNKIEDIINDLLVFLGFRELNANYNNPTTTPHIKVIKEGENCWRLIEE